MLSLSLPHCHQGVFNNILLLNFCALKCGPLCICRLPIRLTVCFAFGFSQRIYKYKLTHIYTYMYMYLNVHLCMSTYLFIYYFDKAKQFAKWVKDRPKVRTHIHLCNQTGELANNCTLQAYSLCGSSGNMGEDREGTYVHIGLSAKQEMRLLGKKKEL